MRKQTKYVKHYYYFLLFALTSILITSLIWNIKNEYQSTVKYATAEGDASYHKDLLFRQWAAVHGGVYVPITDHTQPNPYLEYIDDRDITSTSGKKLTLLNPAYIIRQVFELAEKHSGVKGHITSLNPIRPENKADDWERDALIKFNQGANKYSELVITEGKEYLRFMSSMKVEKQCMKCHAHQGYQIGQTRGGISVSVPMDKYNIIAKEKIKKLVTAHLLMYIIFVSFSTLGYRQITNEMNIKHMMQLKIKTNEAHLKLKNKESEKANQNLRIVNDKLIMAKEKAEESDRLKTAFLQNMSHEIRTPLNAIYGFSGMLNQPDLEEQDSKMYVSIIQKSSDQLLAIVSDILTISSLETKQVKTIIETTNINNLLFDLKTIFNSQAKDKGIELKIHIELKDHLSIIQTDKTKLYQIFTNLLTNALKFTDKGFIEFGYTKENDYLKFYVKDTGVGIEPTMQSKVFDRFRQVEMNEPKGGNGLGLSISKGFIELLHGKIWLESKIGQGTTFYFTLQQNT